MTKEFIEAALHGEVFQSAVVETTRIKFEDYVRDACKLNHCGRYGKSWSCPPAAGTVSELKNKCVAFGSAYVFTTVSPLEDCFDIEGMEQARKRHTCLTDGLAEKLRRTGEAFFILGAGSCNLCNECSYPDEPCRFPERMYPAVEAAGIDVSDLSRVCDVNYINGADTVTYFSVVFFNRCKL